MRVFGKHIFRSIRKHPLEPIMIALTVMLCVAVMIVSVALPININRNERFGTVSDEWTSDFLVTMKSSSERRILFDDDVRMAVGDMADYLGEFSLTGFTPTSDGNKTQVHIGAFDLAEADSFFEIRYLKYGKFTNNNLDRSAIVSDRFAEELGLSIGDTVTVNVLGQPLSYTIEGVARDTGIFKSEEMLVDISSIRNILAERSAFVASLSSDFNPYTKIHIKVRDGVSPDVFKTSIEGRADFSDKKLEHYENQASERFYARILTATIVIPASLLVVIAAMMMISSFDLLQKKRRADNTLFRTVGAEPAQLNLLVYLESLVYALVGGALGCVLSAFAMRWLNGVYEFKWLELSFDLADIAIGLGSSLVFTSICTLLYIKKQRKNDLEDELVDENLDTDKGFSRKKLVLAVPAAVLFAVSLIFSPTKRYPFAFAILLFTVILIYVTLPYITEAAFSLVSRLLSKKRRGAGKLILAAKSCVKSYPLKHAGRVMTMLLMIFISLSIIISAVDTQMSAYVNFAAFDYVGLYVDDETEKRLKDISGVVDVAEFTIERNVVFEGQESVNGVAATVYSPLCFNDTIFPENVPKGDQLALSKGVAAMIGAKIGDRVECTIADIPCVLTLTEIVPTRGDFAFYDAEYVGAELNMTCIRTDGTHEAEEGIMSLFDERGIECLNRDEFYGESYNRVEPQLTVFRAMFLIMLIMTVMGILNILGEQKMARRREFEIIKQNGMTRGGVIMLQVTEIACLLALSLLAAIVFSLVIVGIVNMAAVSFGLTVYK